MNGLVVTRCQCGAITVSCNEFSNSMTYKTFTSEFPQLVGLEEENIYCNCNHCVNNWGLDLCGCGSGEPVGECDGGFSDCRNKIPAQIKMEQREFVGWRT